MLNDDIVDSFASLSFVVLYDQVCHGCSVCGEEKEETRNSITGTDTGVSTPFCLVTSVDQSSSKRVDLL